MKSQRKHWSAIVMTILLILSLVACKSTPTTTAGGKEVDDTKKTTAAEAQTAVAKEGLPIVQTPLKLKAMVAKNLNTPDWNTHPAIVELQKRTNIEVDYESVPQAGWEERRNVAFATNTLPDFMIRAYLSPQLETKYATEKQIIALDELLDYAPNFSKLLSEFSIIRKGIELPDGHFYTLPQLNTTEGNLVQHYWINQNWLDALNLDMPKTLDEFKDVLIAFRDNDPDGNGKNDSLPYSGSAKNDPANLFYNFLGSWGFGVNGIVRFQSTFSYVDVDPDGKVRFLPQDERFKELVTFFASLWSEDLIDKESYSQDRDQIVAKITENRVGFVSDGNNNQWMGTNRGYFVQPNVFVGPHGDHAWINRAGFVQTTGTALITDVNEHPEATMRYLDYFYSEEGTVLARLGIIDKSYTVKDGKYELLDHIKNDPEGLTLDQALGKWALYMGGNVPQYITDHVDQSAAQLPDTKAAVEVIRDDIVPIDIIPNLHFTEDEDRTLSNVGQDISSYTQENVVKFITGKRDISEWDAFLAEYEKLQVEDYLRVLQAAYDRWSDK